MFDKLFICFPRRFLWVLYLHVYNETEKSHLDISGSARDPLCCLLQCSGGRMESLEILRCGVRACLVCSDSLFCRPLVDILYSWRNLRLFTGVWNHGGEDSTNIQWNCTEIRRKTHVPRWLWREAWALFSARSSSKALVSWKIIRIINITILSVVCRDLTESYFHTRDVTLHCATLIDFCGYNRTASSRSFRFAALLMKQK